MPEKNLEQKIDDLFGDVGWKAERLMAKDTEAMAAENERYPTNDEQFAQERKEEWTEVETAAWDDWSRYKLKARKSFYRELLSDWFVTRWIKTHTQLADGRKIVELRNTIQKYLREERKEELEEYLVDVLTAGVAAADRNRKKKLWGPAFWFGIAFVTLYGLFYSVLVFFVCSSGETKFERVVLSVIMLFITGVMASRSTHGLEEIKSEISRDKRFHEIRRALEIIEEPWERDERIEAISKNEKQLLRGIVWSTISIGFALLTASFCLWKLVSALL